jgi:uncharacterized protein YggE
MSFLDTATLIQTHLLADAALAGQAVLVDEQKDIQSQIDTSNKRLATGKKVNSAIDNARAIAEELATAAGVTLGAVQTINVYGGSSPIIVQAKMAEASFAADSVPVQPGQMTITVEVNIVYEIR